MQLLIIIKSSIWMIGCQTSNLIDLFWCQNILGNCICLAANTSSEMTKSITQLNWGNWVMLLKQPQNKFVKDGRWEFKVHMLRWWLHLKWRLSLESSVRADSITVKLSTSAFEGSVHLAHKQILFVTKCHKYFQWCHKDYIKHYIIAA